MRHYWSRRTGTCSSGSTRCVAVRTKAPRSGAHRPRARTPRPRQTADTARTVPVHAPRSPNHRLFSRHPSVRTGTVSDDRELHYGGQVEELLPGRRRSRRARASSARQTRTAVARHAGRRHGMLSGASRQPLGHSCSLDEPRAAKIELTSHQPRDLSTVLARLDRRLAELRWRYSRAGSCSAAQLVAIEGMPRSDTT